MALHKQDEELLNAFLRCELQDYRWAQDGLELIRQSIWLAVKKQAILMDTNEKSVNAINVCSMTNMGQVLRSLLLPTTKWTTDGYVMYFHLGTRPHDPVRGQNRPFDHIEDMTAHLNERAGDGNSQTYSKA